MPGREEAAAFALVGMMVLAGGAPASASYANVASDVGIDFQFAGEVHPADAEPFDDWPAFPETIGAGACFADLDGDGYDDLYLVNQQFNPENPATEGWRDAVDPTNKLYLNRGDGAFDDVTSQAGVEGRGFGYGCSAGDYDGDGDEDLFVANFADARFEPNQLFRNRGDATFDEVSSQAGLAMPGACGAFPCSSTGSAWADYDNDGDLDLYVGNYVDMRLGDRSDQGPDGHKAQANWLFRNGGDGTFAEVAAAAGVAGRATDVNGSKTLGVLWLDHDLDGDQDLYVCNDSTPNEFFENRGDGTFADRSVEAGLDDPRASMGCASGDYDNDGLPDLYMTHYESELNGFYRNNGDGTFEDRSGEDDLFNDVALVGWGTAFVDYDRDRDLDLFMVNGHTEWNLDYDQPPLVFRQDQDPDPEADPWDAAWVDVTAELGPGLQEETVARGAAFADYDHDGDTDVAVVNNANQTASFLRADFGPMQWLTVELRQPGANPKAIGARVALEAGGVTQWREVRAGSSYLGQDTLDLEFGLGEAVLADTLTVHWPDGGTTAVQGVGARQAVLLDRATGTYRNDTLAPRTTVEATPAGAGEWWRGPVSMTLRTEDRGVTTASGLLRTEFAPEGQPWAPYAGETLRFEGEGVHPVRVRSWDLAGNQEQRTLRIGIDATPPAIAAPSLQGTPGLEGWWVSDPVRVTLRAQDGLSGVASFRYREGTGEWQEVRGPFEVTGEGVHRFEAVAVDRAGNQGAPSRFTVAIDTVAPAVALTRPHEGGVYAGNDEVVTAPTPMAVLAVTPELTVAGGFRFDVRADAMDGTSGMDRVVFRVDGQVVEVARAPPYAWTWDTRAWEPGLHEVEALAFDHAGHLAGHEVQTVLVNAAGGAVGAAGTL